MNEIIELICKLDEQINKNTKCIKSIANDSKLDRTVATHAVYLGELTKLLLIEQFKLKQKLLNEYGIFYI